MLLGAMSLTFSACESFDMPNPPAQSNPQEPVFEAANLVLTGIAGDQTIDLAALNESGTPVKLAELQSIENLPEGYSLEFVGQMAQNDQFNNPVDFAVSFKDNVISAAPDVLEGVYHKALNTIAPEARTANVRYIAYAVNGLNRMRLGGKDTYFCPMTASLKPFDPGFTMEDAYYLIGTCTGGTIDATKAIKMDNGGGNPYDFSTFSVVVDITAAEAENGYEWAVVPASTLAAGTGIVYGPADDMKTSAENGQFKAYDVAGVFGTIYEDNKHLISIDLRPDADGLYAYNWILAIPCLYTPGGSNGWSQAASQLMNTTNYIDYTGFINIDGEFKFTSAPDWNHTNYGYASDGKLTTDGGAGNIKVSENGLYLVNANISALTYSLSGPITTIGLIGDATDGGWDADTDLTPSEDFLTWTGTVNFKGTGEFKFRANDAWDINLGGDLEFLTPGGDNIATPGEGTYDVTLDLANYPYTATLVKK